MGYESRCEWQIKRLSFVQPDEASDIPDDLIAAQQLWQNAQSTDGEEREKILAEVIDLVKQTLEFEFDLDGVSGAGDIIESVSEPSGDDICLQLDFSHHPVPVMTVTVELSVTFKSLLSNEELEEWQEENDQLWYAGYVGLGDEIEPDSDDGGHFRIVAA